MSHLSDPLVLLYLRFLLSPEKRTRSKRFMWLFCAHYEEQTLKYVLVNGTYLVEMEHVLVLTCGPLEPSSPVSPWSPWRPGAPGNPGRPRWPRGPGGPTLPLPSAHPHSPWHPSGDKNWKYIWLRCNTLKTLQHDYILKYKYWQQLPDILFQAQRTLLSLFDVNKWLTRKRQKIVIFSCVHK